MIRMCPTRSGPAYAMGALAIAILMAGPGAAQDMPAQQNQKATAEGQPAPAPAAAGPRYAFAPVEGGALKLDTRTGKVSLCAKTATGFTCEAVPDSRDAYEAEIARLQREIAQLKGSPAPNAGTGTSPGGSAELDQALNYAEQLFRRFRSMIQSLSEEPSQQKL